MDVKFTIYKLTFPGALHIADEREEYANSRRTVASDMFYAALTAALAKCGHLIAEDGDLGFTISSLFPFCRVADRELHFLPKPLACTMPLLEDLSSMKAIKKVCWFEASCFNELINGSLKWEQQCTEGEFMVPAADKGFTPFMSQEMAPRVSVSRNGEDAKPFYMERLHFAAHSGLYFIIKGDEAKAESALQVLQDEGIGTDRGVGMGYFTYVKSSLTLRLPKGGQLCSLSMFCPSSEQELAMLLTGEESGYELVRRGGWITTYPYNSYRKNSIYMFTAGSVFNKLCDAPETCGKIVDLSPQLANRPIAHPIWRSGKAIAIPVALK